jgi:hypothetical protein
VRAVTDGRVTEQVEVHVDRREGRPVVSWTTANVFGATHRRSGRTVAVDVQNYLTSSALHAGKNRISFVAQGYGGIRSSRIKVFPDSGVFATRESPTPLRMSILGVPRGSTVGEVTAYQIRIWNAGSVPITRLHIRLITRPEELKVASPGWRGAIRLEPGEARIITFGLIPQSPGAFKAGMIITGSRNTLAANVTLTGKKATSRWMTWIHWVAAAGLAALTIIALRLAIRRNL